MAEKYLLISDLKEGRKLSDKAIETFMKKAFLTDATLIVIGKKDKIFIDYSKYTLRKIFNRTCDIRFFDLIKESDIEKIVQIMSAIITFNNSTALPYIQAAKKFNVPILTDMNSINISVDDEVKRIRSKCEKNFQYISGKFPIKKYEYFLFHEGTAESMAVYFWLKEYRKHHSKKILFICFQALRHELMSSCPYIDVAIKVDEVLFDYISVYHSEEYKIKRSLLQHFDPHSLHMQTIDPSYGIIEKMRDFLEIDPSLKIFERYPVKLPKENIVKAKKIFRKMNLVKGKTVILLPEGYAFGGFSNKANFWVNLAKRLKSEGYEVLTHTKEPFIEGVINIYMKTFDSSAFLGLCGNIISSPTGFIESLCTWNVKDPINWIVVCPHEESGFWKSENPKAECDNFMKYYPNFVSKYTSENLNQKIFKWGINEEEDLTLIEKILDEIKK